MKEYYRKIAERYEDIYDRDDPVLQEEIRQISKNLKETFRGRRVFEVACGTGYWTEFVSETAQSIVASDIVKEMLEIAKRKQYNCPIFFMKEDAYTLSSSNDTFDGGLANFWFSHVPKSRMNSFLEEFHRVLQTGSKVFIADNVYVLGIGGRLISISEDENTYKLRSLKNGNEHLILKNYYTVHDLLNIFGKYAREFDRENISYGNYYWHVVYELK